MRRLLLIVAVVFAAALGASIGAALVLRGDEAAPPVAAAPNDDPQGSDSSDTNQSTEASPEEPDASGPAESCAIERVGRDAALVYTGPEASKLCDATRTAAGENGDYWREVEAAVVPQTRPAMVCSLGKESWTVQVYDAGGQTTGQGICARLTGNGWDDRGGYE